MFTYILFGKQITGHHWLANRKSTLRPKRTFATVSGDGRYTTFPTQHILYCLLLFMHIYIFIYINFISIHILTRTTILKYGPLLLLENSFFQRIGTPKYRNLGFTDHEGNITSDMHTDFPLLDQVCLGLLTNRLVITVAVIGQQ